MHWLGLHCAHISVRRRWWWRRRQRATATTTKTTTTSSSSKNSILQCVLVAAALFSSHIQLLHGQIVPSSVWYICFDHHHLYIIIVSVYVLARSRIKLQICACTCEPKSCCARARSLIRTLAHQLLSRATFKAQTKHNLAKYIHRW